MPTIKGIDGPFRFFFFSFDCNEPPHIHVERDRTGCKFWLEPLQLASNHGFNARDLSRIREIIKENHRRMQEAWRELSTVLKTDPSVERVEVTADEITAFLADGRRISVPLAWSWRLSDATPEQRRNWRIIGGGYGIHWPDVDEDISVRGMLDGVPARRPDRRAAEVP